MKFKKIHKTVEKKTINFKGLKTLKVKSSPTVVATTTTTIKPKKAFKKETAEEYRWHLYKHGFTKSCLNTFSECPYKFKLKYCDGVESKYANTDYLDFGNIFHELKEKLLTVVLKSDKILSIEELQSLNKQFSKAIEEKYKEYYSSEKMVDISEDSNYQLMLGMAEVTLHHYIKHYYNTDFSKYEWLSLEEEFRVKMELACGSSLLRGKWDGRLNIKNKVWLSETKTKGIINEDKITSVLAVDPQSMLYALAHYKRYGEYPRGIIYDVVRRCQLKIGKQTIVEFLNRISKDIESRPEFYFVRWHCILEPNDIQNWVADFEVFLLHFEETFHRRTYYKNYNSCSGKFGQPCEYIKLCTNDDRSFLQKRDKVFSELELI